MICISTPATIGTSPEIVLVAPRRPKLLCINDSSASCLALTRELCVYEIDVLNAPHGMQGYWLAMSEKPDIIVMDVMIDPAEAGQVLECLKKDAETASIPVIALAERMEPGLEDKLQRLGADFVQPLDVPFEEIKACITQHVRLRPKAAN